MTKKNTGRRRRAAKKKANESEARKREATVIRRTIEPFLRDDPSWKQLLERVAGEARGTQAVRCSIVKLEMATAI